MAEAAAGPNAADAPPGAATAAAAYAAAGGPGRPDGLDEGYFVKPTVFADVTNDMTIAQEEIFGPVLTVQSFRSPAEAVALANNTMFGLAGSVPTA